jgi:hypothetical protein
MRLTIFAATFAFLLWGAPAFAGSNPDFDGDGVGDTIDNCSEASNSDQDDTDGDDCGNLCDADYGQTGTVGIADFGAFTSNGFGNANPLYNHTQPVDDVAGFGDFGFVTSHFGAAPGPSGPTAGTTACP